MNDGFGDGSWNRRRLLVALLAGCGVAAGPTAAESGPRPGSIAQGPPAGAEAFMRRAIELRQAAVDAGDQPFGAVVVKDGRIVGEGPSRVVTAGDPTAHAEMEAIRDAARRLGRGNVAGAFLFASSRPCPMCAAAAYWAGLSRVYVGSDIRDGGTPGLPAC
jgi:tRNA(Arg) A34 adenosine deaminase TadA